MFINYIVNDIQARIRLFEDDTTLYITVENPNDLGRIINIDLDKIKNWDKLCLVTFNPNKNEAMLLSRKRNRPDHLTLYFDGTAIQEVTSHKHLGILDWQVHIDFIIAKAQSRLKLSQESKIYS